MTTPTETPTIVTLKDSDYGRILSTIENCAFSETAILTPAYSREIDNILGEMSATVATSTSLAVHIIKTTKLLEEAALHTDMDEGTRTLAVLHLQKRIRAMALHLLPLDFSDLVNLAVRTAMTKPRAEEETRPNHKALANLALAFPIPPSPMPATPIPLTPVPATPSTPAPSSQPLDAVLIEAGDFNLSNGVMLQGSVTPTRAPALPTPAPALLDSPRAGAPPAPRKTAVWTAMTLPPGAMTPPLA
ncbi:uncharacterized protein F5147DRAFT_763094 [Suillus discolor]|uniref:Uncharacterized protein n=1 Tax=Suillus discolor TaxID=1912936 RepID=A0A9P7F0G0_9AGAM|nr:uncharacterized protein F5147DRAFT_763094 [Suillus discolor]KAG2099269.1 hypothetical protein F5147DRAFT_763094 [Suillus discolor]